MISLLEDLQVSKQIRIASDFTTAQEQLLARTPDIVLLDINMPGKNGIELLRFIRENDFGSEVIMLTNHAEDFYREQCRNSVPVFFWINPVTSDWYRTSLKNITATILITNNRMKYAGIDE